MNCRTFSPNPRTRRKSHHHESHQIRSKNLYRMTVPGTQSSLFVWRQINPNESESHQSEKRDSLQQAKHAKLHSDLSIRLKGDMIDSSGVSADGILFLRLPYPHSRENTKQSAQPNVSVDAISHRNLILTNRYSIHFPQLNTNDPLPTPSNINITILHHFTPQYPPELDTFLW